jgi:hypothetical protein
VCGRLKICNYKLVESLRVLGWKPITPSRLIQAKFSLSRRLKTDGVNERKKRINWKSNNLYMEVMKMYKT